MSDEKQISEVLAEEMRRGKRPIDIAERRRALLIRKKFTELVESKDEQKFKESLITDLGQIPGTPEYEQSLKAWKSYHGEE
jgi:hypothetical protein